MDSNNLFTLINNIQSFLWGGPVLVILLGVGVLLSYKTKFIQVTGFFTALKLVFNVSKGKGHGDISPFQSLMTALAGAIGTGNIAGIATAVATGGFGSLFWMWVVAFFGMATAYYESKMAIKFRQSNAAGEMSGGPMYSLLYGVGNKPLAITYAILAGISALGIGCLVQTNSVVDAAVVIWDVDRLHIGIVLALITGSAIIGGVKSIGRVAGIMVPIMAFAYLISGLLIVMWNYERLFDALMLIFSSAFTGQAAVGGFLGSTMMLAMQSGAQYGIFANEAGLGTMAIAAASAKTDNGHEQGLRSMAGVFFATMVVCTVTGLVIATTGVLGTTADGQVLKGSPLAMHAFSSFSKHMTFVVIFGLLTFAFTTMLAWAYYGEKCFEFLLGRKAGYAYRWVFTGVVIMGSVIKLEFAWALANVASALMSLPNLISLYFLSNLTNPRYDQNREHRRLFSLL